MGFLSWLFHGRGYGADELARRLDIELGELRKFEPKYVEFTIAKRSGGRRQIMAPSDDLKLLQRRVLRRVLRRLRCHDAAHGFERGRSIVTNALPHQGQAVVMRFDLVDFFQSTTAARIQRYFRFIGWNRQATRILVKLCTYRGSLPQGAPTSPRLSNLVNHLFDARLAGMAQKCGGTYTRYADDITVSFAADVIADVNQQARMRSAVYWIATEAGYHVHRRKKNSVRRAHHCQMVTGLVVNDRVNLPRKTRRWLRAVEHRTRMANPLDVDFDSLLEARGRQQPTLTPAELEGWVSLQKMVAEQSQGEHH